MRGNIVSDGSQTDVGRTLSGVETSRTDVGRTNKRSDGMVEGDNKVGRILVLGSRTDKNT